MAPTSTITKTKASSILKLPLDTRNDPFLLRMNQLLYIPETGIYVPGKKTTPILDFSSHFDRSSINWFTDDYIGFNEDIMAQTKDLADAAMSMDESVPNPAVIFKLYRTHWYLDSKFTVTKPGYVHRQSRRETTTTANESQSDSSRNQAAEDEESSQEDNIQNDSVLAESSSPLLAYGVTNISFPANSLHSSHPITVRPANVDRRTQCFVQDSVSYAWEVNRRLFPGGGGVLSLYKGIGATKKIEIGRYQSDNGKIVPGGILVIDSDEVDVLIAVMTLLSVLLQRDSFSVPSSRHVM